MKVYELENEMVCGQEWAIEVRSPFLDPDGEVYYDTQRYEYKVGEARSFRRFYDMTIDYIRCVCNCITIVVTERTEPEELPFPDV